MTKKKILIPLTVAAIIWVAYGQISPSPKGTAGVSGTPGTAVQSVQGPVAEGGTNTGAPVPIGIHSPTGIRWWAATNNLSDGDGGTRLPAVAQWLYNGAAYVNGRTVSATNLALTTAVGSALIEKGARWSVNSNPAVSTQATASKAAGGAGVRHVVDCISFSSGATTAPGAATALTVQVRDGASGAGTIIWERRVVAPASTGTFNEFATCGLNLIGTANTAMTIEWSALLTSLFESVSLSGYSVQ